MACATGTASAKLSNVRMLVMFDRSSSMNDEADRATGASRWDLASSALTGFFADPAAAGLQVALRFFPHDSPAPGCNDDACDVTACAQPIVPLATLAAEPADAHESALVQASIAALPPVRGPGQGNNAGNQGTPIGAALGGGLAWAAEQRVAAPDENAVVVLVTDGAPNGCGDIETIAGLSQAAFATSGIRTYAIGLTGSRESDINAIAAAGGTTKGIFISDGATAKQDLLNALAEIRGSVLDCDFEMPQASDGQQIDPDKVNVKYTPAGGTQMTLGRVPDVASCGTAPGWYYDNPQSPSHISLCPASCSSASVEVDATLEVLLGCVTESRDPA